MPPGTLRRWKSEAGETGPPSGKDPDDWATQKELGAKAAWVTAKRALRKVNELLAAGKMADAQKGALAFAILVDKSHLLEVNAATARTHVVDGEMGSAQIPIPDGLERLDEVTSLLREIGAIDVGPREDGDDRGGDDPAMPLLLPPGVTDPESAPEVGEFEPMAAPRRAVRVTGEPRPMPTVGTDEEAEDAEEVHAAEVVPEPAWTPLVEEQRPRVPVESSRSPMVVHVDLTAEQPEPPELEDMDPRARVHHDDRFWR